MEQRSTTRAVKLPPERFLSLMAKVGKGECVLIDVRSHEEYRAERIEGAVNFPVDSIVGSVGGMDRGTPLLVYCRTGNRSVRAAEQLARMGFNDISVLEGGIEALKAYLGRLEGASGPPVR